MKAEIENSIEAAFNSIAHMVGNMFSQFSKFIQTQNEYGFDKKKQLFEETPLGESYEEVAIEALPTSLELIDPESYPHLSQSLLPLLIHHPILSLSTPR